MNSKNVSKGQLFTDWRMVSFVGIIGALILISPLSLQSPFGFTAPAMLLGVCLALSVLNIASMWRFIREASEKKWIPHLILGGVLIYWGLESLFVDLHVWDLVARDASLVVGSYLVLVGLSNMTRLIFRR